MITQISTTKTNPMLQRKVVSSHLEREREREREIPGISNRQAAVKLGGKICGSAPQRWRRERERERERKGPRIAIAA
jgi:hypothetical protein